MNRLQEIEQRLSSIKLEMDKPESNLEELNKEVDTLLEERKAIKEKIEQRKGMLDKISMGDGAVIKEFKEERNLDTNFTPASIEYRNAYLKNIRGLELNDVEKRAFSSASNSAGSVIPTQTANEIIKKMKQYAPLLGEITLLQVAGNVKFAVEGTKNDAALHTENNTISGDADTLTEVSLSSYEITKLVQVSKTVATMSIDAFESWLTDMLAEKVSAKISRYLISGTGSSEPAGVGSITWTDNTNQITVAKAVALTSANVQSLIALLPGSYDANGKFLMSKKTLFTDFMPLQDNSKNSIVTVQGNSYFVYGYPVMLDEDITIHEAYLGDFKKIVGNLSEAINIISGFDINTNSYKYLGCAMFDSKVADSSAFVHLAKATA